MTTNGTILLVEDNEDDVFLMKRALKSAGVSNPLAVVADGQQAVDYLSGHGPYSDRALHPLPNVVFLDLKLPIRNGLDVLAWIRNTPHLDNLVVLVLTSSKEPSDLKQAYSLGANSYMVKPPTADLLLELAKAFKGYWLGFNQFSSGVSGVTVA